ncbi:MAG: hypothetical protein R3E12_06730 [Candidatus Eisenbacteria bacterium]|uniref:PepSY domain-containing protein n=1 Tax=Eiseniibacteriota bacterium TaxID=2212470 RepID=A0A956LW05_UNCEI|nr:hypothetical protein [Candidatus Eisenbacteria bacterium]
MRRMLGASIAALILAAGAVYVLKGSAARSSEEKFAPATQADREVSLDEVPAAVRATILREAGTHEVSEVEEVVRNGETFFEADWMENGREVEIRVSSAGRLLDRGFGSDDEDEPDEGDEPEDGPDGPDGNDR